MTWIKEKEGLDLESKIEKLKSGEKPIHWWRCKSHQKAQVGHIAYLYKQGQSPNGIFGKGTIISKAKKRKYKDTKRWMVKIEIEALVDPENEMLVDKDKLKQNRITDKILNGQGSGNEIPSEYIKKLKKLTSPRNKTQNPILVKVKSPQDVLKNIKTFNDNCSKFSDRAENIIRKTIYWVFEPKEKTFCPSKFAGYMDMSFSTYEEALKENYSGVKFDGNVTKIAIEKALDKKYSSNKRLVNLLSQWGNNYFGTDIFSGIDISGWKFIKLPKLDNWGTILGIIEHSDEGEDSSSGSRGGQGYENDPVKRKTIEDYAMNKARKHYEDKKYKVEDTSANNPYDFYCTKLKDKRRVEVKGTTGSDKKFILTIGEVNSARKTLCPTDLFIFHSIIIKKDKKKDEKFIASGGQMNLIKDWIPLDADLKPTQFDYSVPKKCRS